MNIYEKLLNIQTELKAPKGQTNKFGGYKYRSCEDILEAVKPLLKEYKATLKLEDTMEQLGERYYIKARAVLINTEYEKGNSIEYIENTAYARESETKKGMDDSQITGTASSYARKYALNGLFCIDDTKDADTNEFVERTQIENKKITKTQTDALYEIIKSRAIENDYVIASLKEKGYDKLSDIKTKDYMGFVKDFESFVRN